MVMRIDMEAKRIHIENDIHIIGQARRRAKRAAESISEVEECLKLYRKMLCSSENGEKFFDDAFAYLEEKVSDCGDKIASDLSEAFCEASRVFPFYHRAAAPETKAIPSGFVPEIADAFVEDGVLFIRLPMLGKRVFNAKNIGGQWALEGSPFYRKELKAALLRVEDQIPWEANHTLNYVFVYGTNRVGLDSDNHDTKGITDTICSMFRGSDDNRYCSFTYDTLHTKAVPEGTYIAVTAQKSQPYDPEQTVKKWREHSRKEDKNKDPIPLKTDNICGENAPL